MNATEERFWSKVQKGDGCWKWTAHLSTKGYGRFSITRSNVVPAHRFAFELAGGQVPAGMVVDHMCHNRSCVNPAHLRPLSPKQNNENRLGPNKNSSTGIRGVFWSKQKQRWVGQVMHERHCFHAGFHKTIEAAEAAVVAKRLELFTHNDADKKAA